MIWLLFLAAIGVGVWRYIVNQQEREKQLAGDLADAINDTFGYLKWRVAHPKEAEEGISYGKPCYKYHGMLAGFDAYKNHIGFEIWADELQNEDRKTLEEKGYKPGSRTFQIRYDQKVPTAVIKKMLEVQAKINEGKK